MENKIGELLKSQRKLLGLTGEEVAKACDVNVATYYKWEAGTISEIGSSKIAVLAKTLRISPSKIVGDLTDEEFDEIVKPDTANVRAIPCYGKAATIEEFFSDSNILTYVSVPDSFLPTKNAEYFAWYADSEAMRLNGMKSGELYVFCKSEIVNDVNQGLFFDGKNYWFGTFFMNRNGLPCLINSEAADKGKLFFQFDFDKDTINYFKVLGIYSFKITKTI